MTYIIAEAACSHGGDVLTAKHLIDVAIRFGCDCVKFQAFEAELIPNLKKEELRFLRKCEFGISIWKDLIDFCGDRIDFLLTPFDLPSVEVVRQLGLPKVKVPSGRLFDNEYMEAVKGLGVEIIASTGMCSHEEVMKFRRQNKRIKLLHCTTAYPCGLEDVNLSVLRNSKMYSGLSDHTLSTIIPAVAVGMGAEIIEKHVTLYRGNGPDDSVSLLPDELNKMVKNIRTVEKALGSGKKKIEDVEYKMIYRKVL